MKNEPRKGIDYEILKKEHETRNAQKDYAPP